MKVADAQKNRLMIAIPYVGNVKGWYSGEQAPSYLTEKTYYYRAPIGAYTLDELAEDLPPEESE